MELFYKWLPRLISAVLSLVEASNLRNRVYTIENEHELMWTALDDIARMHKDHPAGAHARRCLDSIERTYGK
jgi:hypothetical protein